MSTSSGTDSVGHEAHGAYGSRVLCRPTFNTFRFLQLKRVIATKLAIVTVVLVKKRAVVAEENIVTNFERD